jgi:hypothetical protein
MYPAEIVLPMKAELVDNGFEDLTTAAEVEQAVKQDGTTLVASCSSLNISFDLFLSFVAVCMLMVL